MGKTKMGYVSNQVGYSYCYDNIYARHDGKFEKITSKSSKAWALEMYLYEKGLSKPIFDLKLKDY